MHRNVQTVVRGSLIGLVTGLLIVAGCATPPERAVDEGRASMVRLGEPFDTQRGQIFVLRIQDEFRLIRCIPDGPIAGCYEDVYSVNDQDVAWNSWIDVDRVPGLRLAFVSPTAIAVARDPAVATKSPR
jgi:hypothetical protein